MTSISAALEFQRTGRFEAALLALADDPTSGAALVRGVCALTLGNKEKVATEADLIVASGTAEESSFARALRACVDGSTPRLLDLGTAGSYIDEAVFFTAYAHHRYDRHQAALGVIDAHEPKTAFYRGRYHMLRGAIRSALGDYTGHAESVSWALREFQSCEPQESYQMAHAAMIIAALTRELVSMPPADDLAALEKQIAWTPELNAYRFQLLRTLGWRASQLGRTSMALKYFAKAGFYATTPQLRAFAHLDRVEAAAAAGEHHSAEAERVMAIECLSSIDWSTITDESIAVLPTAARVLAGTYDDEALEYAALARRLIAKMDKRWSFAHGPRFGALVDEGASFARASRDPNGAVTTGVAAYEVFERIGYVPRAIRVALHLAALTGQELWASRAGALQAGTRSLGTRLVGEPLTPRQAAVAQYLDSTLTLREIGERLGMATSTAKTHALKIYSRVGARDRVGFRRAMRAS